MLFDKAELLFAAVTLLCVLASLLPHDWIAHEQLASRESSTRIPGTFDVGDEEEDKEEEEDGEDDPIIMHHRGHPSDSDYYHRFCDSGLEMLPPASRIQKQSDTQAKPPKVFHHRSSPRDYWKCVDCGFRLDQTADLPPMEITVGPKAYLIQHSDIFLVKSHIRQRHGTPARYGCHFCILQARDGAEVQGDYTRIVTTFEGRDGLLQHIASRHFRKFPSPKILQVVDGSADLPSHSPDIRLWRR